MKEYLIYIIESLVVVLLYFLIKHLINRATKRRAISDSKDENRLKIIQKVVNFILGVIAVIIVFMIWGVKQSDLALFLTSVLTVVGIAFFAQWSIISNITSAFIIFFGHPAKIGDEIEIFDKDYPIKGTIKDIGVFFITVETEEKRIITIPSNIFMQKMIVKGDN